MLKKAVLTVFVALLVGFGATSAMAIDGLTAPASVYVNPGALGDNLIYGYYNVRGNLNLFNVINTGTTDGAKVRVVFRAGKNSEEVLDFNVCLSRNDVWTAYLVDSGSTAMICPFDTDTITAPVLSASCVTFKIPAGSSLTNDDLREGYFEILGFQSIPGYDKNLAPCPAGATCPIKNESDCALFNSGLDLGNVLMGNNAIVELSTLGTYSYNATALANSRAIPFIDPGLGQEVRIDQVVTGGCATLDPVLMKTHIISPFDIMASLDAGTELIITAPTRRACHRLVAAAAPFTCTPASATSPNCADQYTTPVIVSVFDDKEHRQDVLQFSPFGGSNLPWEVNVLKMGTGDTIWTSSLAQTFGITVGDLGWVDINLIGAVAPNGLPVIAYTTQTFVDGAATYMVPTAYTTNLNP